MSTSKIRLHVLPFSSLENQIISKYITKRFGRLLWAEDRHARL